MATRNRRGFGRRLLILIVVLVVAFLVYRHFTQKPPAAPQMPATQVGAVTVEPQDIRSSTNTPAASAAPARRRSAPASAAS
ncbi:MAG: hypothetical protein WDN72_07855 [Alphaproteobacteria bacterium]